MLNFPFIWCPSRSCHALRFVPPHKPPKPSDIIQLQNFVNKVKKLLIITGAGISTESGIPDYRSEVVGLFARSGNHPVKYQEFIKYSHIRKRYWARNFVSWPRFSSTMPNSSHFCLNQWECSGRLHWLVTQNVDSLHLKAGSKKITELHGTGFQVTCLSCGHIISRSSLQNHLEKLNPDWHVESFEILPDGDVFLTDEQVKNFQVAFCEKCINGILKPCIVFFGDNVPNDRRDYVFNKVDTCDSVLVIGSSLQTYSSYRLLLKAHDQGKSIAIVNIGPTRADEMANLKVNTSSGNIIPKLVFGK